MSSASNKRDGKQACLENLTNISWFTYRRSKLEGKLSQPYYASFSCCRQNSKKMNRYSFSKLLDFCIRKAHLQFPLQESIYAFSLNHSVLPLPHQM